MQLSTHSDLYIFLLKKTIIAMRKDQHEIPLKIKNLSFGLNIEFHFRKKEIGIIIVSHIINDFRVVKINLHIYFLSNLRIYLISYHQNLNKNAYKIEMSG